MHAHSRKVAGEIKPPNPDRDNQETRYDTPFSWWGGPWASPESRSLVWLIESGSLDARLAAFLSLAVEFRRSIIVVAEQQGAGKTTLLTALLDFLPPDAEPVYLRGLYERFSFLETVPADRAYMLCNEISGHLPTYLWGQGVRRVFQANAGGYPFLTTMHATSTEDALAQLERYPLEIPPAEIAGIDLVVNLDVGYVNTRYVRRVMSVDLIDADGDGYRAVHLSGRSLLRSPLEHRLGRLVSAVARWAGCDDNVAGRVLGHRERFLVSLLEQGLTAPDDIRRNLRQS
jgi:energy-coupling factor transporter ATP-binding protein EcfA2